jgi:pyridoxamine 5'-phosphate oxidase
MTKELWRLGDQYEGQTIDPATCDPDPFVEVRHWLASAVAHPIAQANAMTLATVDERGRPAARIVLLKELDATGFVFFTNYESRKGRDLAAHPAAALVLFWEPQHRQIRIEGSIEKVATEISDVYFASRPRGSQLGAIASPQSEVIESRTALEAMVAKVATGVLGWISRRARCDRAVARPALALARSRRVSPRLGRSGLDPRAYRAVTLCRGG